MLKQHEPYDNQAMSPWTTLTLYFLFSHAISFLCSILEAALLSCTPSYAATLAKSNPSIGQSLMELKDQIEKPLAAILTFNTASHTFGAAGVGAMVEAMYGDAYLPIAAIIVTLSMLYLTEMIPKSIGARYWRNLLPYLVPLMKMMVKVSYPFVLSFEWIGRLFGGRKPIEVNEQEIKTLIEEGASLGIFEELEKRIVFKVFHVADSKANIFMIGRKDIQWIDLDAKEKFNRSLYKNSTGIFLICKNSIDNPIGYITDSDILEQLVSGKEWDPEKIKRTIHFAPESIPVLQLIEVLNKNKAGIAVLMDEYGGVAGLIRQEDILNELIKDVLTFFRQRDELIVKTSEYSWEIDCALSINDFAEIFVVDVLEEAAKLRYHTLAGFCLARLQSIPKVGDEFFYQGYNFKIVKMSNNRIGKVLVTKAAPA